MSNHGPTEENDGQEQDEKEKEERLVDILKEINYQDVLTEDDMIFLASALGLSNYRK